MAPRPQLGRLGIWSGALWAQRVDAQQAARELERIRLIQRADVERLAEQSSEAKSAPRHG